MRPSWEKNDLSEEEYQELLRKRGEQESRRISDNYWLDGDVTGYDDGRPGIGFNPSWWLFGGSPFTLGISGHIWLYVLGLVLALVIVIVGQALKATQPDTQSGTAPAQALQEDQ